MIGQLLTGRYLILEKLGNGGFSETYLARDKYLPRHPLCVVKRLQLPAHSTIQLETADRLFATEADLLGQLGQDHAQIPTLFAYSQEQDSTYLVQEYIEGENLSTWLSLNRRFTVQTAIALLLELLPVLDYIHSHHVIHCDITPSNLIRRRADGKIVLIDFGAAHPVADPDSARHPDADALLLAIGTPGYIPDEQRLGMPQFNSDLYALGILVIQLLTRTDPRQFKQDLISGELDWQRYLKPSSIPSNLVHILDRMVRSRVSDRYQQASEVLADLQALETIVRPRRWQPWAKILVLPTSTALVAGVLFAQLPKLKQTYGQRAKFAIHQLQQKVSVQSNNQLSMVREIPIESGIDRLLIAPNKKIMVSVGPNRQIQLWSLPQGKRIALLNNKAPITPLEISSDSNFLVGGREDGQLQLWDIRSGKLIRQWTGHEKSVIAIAISPDQRILTSTSKDRTIRQWNLRTGALLHTLKFPLAEITAITYPATSDHLITASRDHQLHLWNLRSGQIERTFSGHTDEIVALQMINDRTLISFGKDRGLVWDLDREMLTQVLPPSSADPVLMSKCDRNLMTVHGDGRIRTWIPNRGKLVLQESGTLDHPEKIAFSPTHDYLVSWSAHQRLRFWQIRASR